MDMTLTPEDIGRLCAAHLSRVELQVVIDTCIARPEIVSTISVDPEHANVPLTGPEVARWMLNICRQARQGGSA